MTDRLSPERRSWNMSRIRGADTAPERRVRSLLHKMGYRFRLHSGKLPGKPDIVLSKHRTLIFVHGCYWHRHPNCRYAYTPKSRTEFWIKKFNDNVARDEKVRAELELLGWRVLCVWECETKNLDHLEGRLRRLLRSDIH